MNRVYLLSGLSILVGSLLLGLLTAGLYHPPLADLASLILAIALGPLYGWWRAGDSIADALWSLLPLSALCLYLLVQVARHTETSFRWLGFVAAWLFAGYFYAVLIWI